MGTPCWVPGDKDARPRWSGLSLNPPRNPRRRTNAHGIKVVEFQTPHYERLILMFAQKVITQNHWDTENAINKLETAVYHPPKLDCIHNSKYLIVERFTDFPQFNFDRIRLEPKKTYEILHICNIESLQDDMVSLKL